MLNIFKGTDCLTRLLFDKENKKEVVIVPIESGHSFGAFNDEGELIGIKLGKILTSENIQS